MRSAFVLVAAGLSLVACTPSADAPPPVTRAAAVAPAAVAPTVSGDGTVPANRWHAVLVAGDSSTPAFDNGVEAMRVKLAAHGVTDIAVYSADPASVPAERLSSSGNVRRALRTGGGGACLAFVTSHGNEDGFFLRPDRRLFGPSLLDQALAEGCGAVPTVVVISACHSGTFIDNGARRPNRIILAAAATDRTSFGCGADDEYTWYDWCLLHQFDGATTWSGLASATRTCVEGLERRMGVRASLPQIFVGAQVADLRIPGR